MLQVIVPKGQRSVRLQNSFCFPKGAGHKVVIFLLVLEGIPLGLLDEIWWVNKNHVHGFGLHPFQQLEAVALQKTVGPYRAEVVQVEGKRCGGFQSFTPWAAAISAKPSAFMLSSQRQLCGG